MASNDKDRNKLDTSHDDDVENLINELADILLDMWIAEMNQVYNERSEET